MLMLLVFNAKPCCVPLPRHFFLLAHLRPLAATIATMMYFSFAANIEQLTTHLLSCEKLKHILLVFFPTFCCDQPSDQFTHH